MGNTSYTKYWNKKATAAASMDLKSSTVGLKKAVFTARTSRDDTAFDDVDNAIERYAATQH